MITNILAIILFINILALIGMVFFLLNLVKRMAIIQKAQSLHDLELFDKWEPEQLIQPLTDYDI